MKDDDRPYAERIKGFARVIGVEEDRLLNKANLVQEGIQDLDDMEENTYYYLYGMLMAIFSWNAPDEDIEPKDGTGEWYEWKHRKEEEEKEYAEAMRYRDYCEAKYGWDCS